MTNPLEAYAHEKNAAQAKRKENEVALWRRWMDNGQKPEHLEPLLKAYAPIFAQKMRAYRAPSTGPESAFKGEIEKHFIAALKSYDPTRGAAINTHVEQRLKKVMRYNNRYQNLAYIPEGQSKYIGKLQKAQTELKEELGREPTHKEIADHLGMPVKTVTTVFKSVRKDSPMSHGGGPDMDGFNYDVGGEGNARGFEDQQIALASTILPTIFPGKPDLHLVFDHVFGTNGKKQVQSTGALAKILGKSEPQVSRLKTTMGDLLRKHMGIGEENE